MAKLLLDQNLSFKLCERLADAFPGSTQARLVALDRASDLQLWDYAGANGFVLVSHDADFAELAALRGPPPKVVWLRSGNRATATIEAMLRSHQPAIEALIADTAAACLELY